MEKNLVLLHSNDIHGDFLTNETEGKKHGGISYLSGYVKDVRKKEKNVIYAIAGDLFRGSVIDSEYKGVSTIELVNYLNPDVVTLGNHEVDYGLAHLLFIEKCAKFPIINANFFIKTNNSRIFTPYFVKEIDGLNIMFIGILTEEVLAQTKNEEIIGTFVDIKEAAKEIGVICDNYRTTKTDLTVLLTHIGFEEDKKLAELLNPEWGVDLIIGGHSHTLLEKEEVVNGVPIVQVGTGTGNIGRFDLKFIDGKFDSYRWQCVKINEDTSAKDETMETILKQYKDETDTKYKRILTVFSRKLTHPSRYQETELGNLYADLLQADSSFDVMLYASGSIRKKELGPVLTYQDLLENSPFDNAPVYMLEVTGKQFKAMMLFMLRDEAFNGDHTEFYQLSAGMHLKYKKSSREMLEFTLNGEGIKDEQMIKIALQDYHYKNFTDFFGFDVNEVLANKKAKVVMTSAFSIFEELFTASTNLDSKIEGRIEIID